MPCSQCRVRRARRQTCVLGQAFGIDAGGWWIRMYSASRDAWNLTQATEPIKKNGFVSVIPTEKGILILHQIIHHRGARVRARGSECDECKLAPL